MRVKRLALLATPVAVCVLAAAGCGSSNKDNSASAPSGTTTSAQSGTTTSGTTTSSTGPAALAPFLERPTSIGITQPVGKPIPSGKTIAYVQCFGSPQCVTAGQELQTVGKTLGWNVKIFSPAGVDASAVQAAYDQALAIHPDALAYIGTSAAQISRQLQKAKQANIPVFAGAVEDEHAPGVTAIAARTGSPFDVARQEGSGEFVGHQSPPGSRILIGVIGGYSGTEATNREVTSGIKKVCPTCTVKPVEVAPTQIADAPKILANAARTQPNTKWILMTLDSIMGKGLGAALRNAGVTDVKYGGTAAIEDGVQRVRNGDESFVEVYPIKEVAWTLGDLMARHFAGADLAPATDVGPKPWFLTKDNVPAENTFPSVADYQAQFKRLWGR